MSTLERIEHFRPDDQFETANSATDSYVVLGDMAPQEMEARSVSLHWNELLFELQNIDTTAIDTTRKPPFRSMIDSRVHIWKRLFRSGAPPDFDEAAVDELFGMLNQILPSGEEGELLFDELLREAKGK